MGTSGRPLDGVNKCFHGGSWDGLGREGINKDAAVCHTVSHVISPHYDHHYPAANAARMATVEYFRNIRTKLISEKGEEEGTILFKKFLGFGSEIGFAIDTTGSMSQEISGVKSAASAIVSGLVGTDKEPSQYVLGIINDPYIPSPFTTTDSDAFLSRLSSLYAGYGGNGGDCPELAGLGTLKVVSALGEGGKAFTYTDASIKDRTDSLAASALAFYKNVGVNNALSGSCSPYDSKYFEISDVTGGQVFIINPSEAGKLAELTDILLSDYATGFLTIGDKLTADNNKSYSFKADLKTNKISIFISLLNGSATVKIVKPDGSAVKPDDEGVKRTVLSAVVVYEIDAPQIGEWQIGISGSGEFSINVIGDSPLSFSKFKFVEYDNSAHPGFFEIEGYPLAGSETAVEATIWGAVSDVYFEIRGKQGNKIDRLNLNIVDEYPQVKTVFLKEDFIVPDQDFIVYAFGQDENGTDFQRVLARKVAPQYIKVTAPFDGELPLGEDKVLSFKVFNNGENGSYNFSAIDDKGFVIAVNPKTATIDKGESVEVNVTLNAGKDESAIGVNSVLTFLAQPVSADKLGNFAVVENRMVKAKPKNTLPQTSLITSGATINDKGEVFVWGFRGSGQQGNGKISVSSSNKPAKVESLTNIVQLTGGAYHLIALDQDGNLYGWGQSGYGETGCKPNTGIYVTTPCKVLNNIVQAAAGEYFTIALSNDGKVYAFGHNLYGQLGNGNSKNSQTPVLVDLGGEKARLIGGAYEGAFAVTENNKVYAWGDNEASGLGFQGTNYGVQKIVRTPTHITNLDQYASKIIYIAGGNGWSEALLDDGRVIGWGLQASLGQGTTKTSLSSPNPVIILDGVKQLFARYVGSIALSDDGTIYAWGQTGGSAFKSIYGERPTPHNVAGVVTQIGGGKEHIFYKTEEGDLYGVGYNDLYKLNLNKLGGIVDWDGERVAIE
ncbi:MAG: hypothetical protein LBF86_03175 [Helicobacteraceae bacterium]|nr:hypothetical protein [Helicobacteraceae bacterium]